MYPELDGRRRSAGGTVFVTVVVALMLYLSFAALQGEHGLLRLFQLETQEARLRAEFEEVRAERATLAARAARLSAEAPDLDLLDERARRVLGLGRPDEMIVR